MKKKMPAAVWILVALVIGVIANPRRGTEWLVRRGGRI